MNDAPLALLIVDVCEAWEEHLKDVERGYRIGWDDINWGFVRDAADPRAEETLHYPHGTPRAGLDAIIDTVRMAHGYGVEIYAVHLYDGWTDGEEQSCHSLRPYIKPGREFEKGQYSAFTCRTLADAIERDGVKRLLIVGFDRDVCVIASAKDAIERGIEVVTSEHVMLTKDANGLRRDVALDWYRSHTTFLESLVDVRNLLWNEAKKRRP